MEELASTPGPGGGPSLTVLHCVPRLYVGGINRALVTTLGELVRGPDRHVVCTLSDRLDLAPEIEALGVPVISLGHRSTRDGLRTSWRLRRLLRERQVDVVHAHALLARFYAGIAARSAGVPLVATLHNVDSKLEIDPSARRVRARALGAAQDLVDTLTTRRLVAVSEAVADVQLGQGRLRRRAVVIPNGVDVDRFATEDRAAVARLDEELGLPDGALVLVNVGRMVFEKDQRLLVPVVVDLVERGHDAHVLVVGEGPESTAVATAARAAGIERRVHLLGLRSDVADLLHRADVVVVPSIREGFSVAVLEAMAAGRPIVASDIAPIAEAVRPDVDGRLVAVGDAAAFAAAIDALVSDPAAAARLTASARARVAATFSVDATARGITTLYREVARA